MFSLGSAVININAKLGPLKKALGATKRMVGGLGRGMVRFGKLGARGAMLPLRMFGKLNRSVGRLTGGLVGSMVKLAALIGIAMGLKKSVSLFFKQEQAGLALASALKTVNDEARKGEIMKYAGQLQELSRQGDEATAANIAFGIQLGLTTDEAKKAAKGAIGLATALKGKISIEDAMRGIAKESQAMNSMLGESLAELKDVTDIRERMAIISKKAAEGWQAEQEATESASGSWAQFLNTLGDAGEKIGEFIAGGGGGLLKWLEGGVKQFIKGMDIIIEWKQGIVQSFNDASAGASGFFGIVKSVFGVIADIFHNAVFMIANFGLTWEVLKEEATNAFTTIVARVKWFGTVVAQVGMHFFRNWKEIFMDIWNMSKTIFTNMIENMKRLFTGLWKFIKSGGKEGFEEGFVNLTEGFGSSVKEDLVIDTFVPPKLKTEARKRFAEMFAEYNKMRNKKDKTITDQEQEVEKQRGFEDMKASAKGLAKQKVKMEVGGFKGLTQVWKDVQSNLLKEEDKIAKQQLAEQKAGNKQLAEINAKTAPAAFAILN